jgi:hypothetical protein
MSPAYWNFDGEPVGGPCAGCRPGCAEVCEVCPENVSHSGPENAPGCPRINPDGEDGQGGTGASGVKYAGYTRRGPDDVQV